MYKFKILYMAHLLSNKNTFSYIYLVIIALRPFGEHMHGNACSQQRLAGRKLIQMENLKYFHDFLIFTDG